MPLTDVWKISTNKGQDWESGSAGSILCHLSRQEQKEAFDSVLVVTQDAEAGIANARTSAELMIQSANRSRDRIQTNARPPRRKRPSRPAKVATASIAALARDTQNMPHATLMSRLYYDRIGPIIKRAGHVKLVGPDAARLVIPGASPR